MQSTPSSDIVALVLRELVRQIETLLVIDLHRFVKLFSSLLPVLDSLHRLSLIQLDLLLLLSLSLSKLLFDAHLFLSGLNFLLLAQFVDLVCHVVPFLEFA